MFPTNNLGTGSTMNLGVPTGKGKKSAKTRVKFTGGGGEQAQGG